MKHYRHMSTMREEFLAQRKRDRIQAGYDFLLALFVCLAVVSISVMVLL